MKVKIRNAVLGIVVFALISIVPMNVFGMSDNVKPMNSVEVDVAGKKVFIFPLFM